MESTSALLVLCTRNIAEENPIFIDNFHSYWVLNFPIGIIEETSKDVARHTLKEFADGITKRILKRISGKNLIILELLPNELPN